MLKRFSSRWRARLVEDRQALKAAGSRLNGGRQGAAGQSAAGQGGVRSVGIRPGRGNWTAMRRGGTGLVLGYWPRIHLNPFHDLLYARAPANEIAVAPLNLPSLVRVPRSSRLVLHLHWLHRCLDGAVDDRDAMKRARRFLKRLKQRKTMGAGLVWSIHNALSHSATFPEAERYLRGRVAGLADVLHIMNPETGAAVRDMFALPYEKCVHIPHPAFTGFYDTDRARPSARHRLGVSGTAPVFLLFGRLAPYKGLLEFLEIFSALSRHYDGGARCLIAGSAGPPGFMAALEAKAASLDGVTLRISRTDDDGLADCFAASDVVVCPYDRGLNSGVAMTALSFGRPVVVPPMIAAALTGAHDHVHSADPASAPSLLAACIGAERAGRLSVSSAGLRQWLQDRHPDRISDSFCMALRRSFDMP
ncbi:glycosyltransferase family 4 protein [Eilatimonas milleporae]|nr:glycosyltransferase family 4 protein [Eilatimonas milleporae]